MLSRNASVPIPAAAELAGVDVRQIHRWAENGGLEIEQRGDMQVVRLDRVMMLAGSPRRRDPRSDRGTLRARLGDAALDPSSVAGLQQLARDRTDGGQ